MITSTFTCTCAELLTYHLLQCEYDLMRIESLHIAFVVAGWNCHSLVFVCLKFCSCCLFCFGSDFGGVGVLWQL